MTPSKPPMGINVASDTKAGLRFADMIVDGHKTLESRNSDTLRPYVGKRVAIVRTGEGKAKAIGEVTVGEPKVVNQRQFRAMEDEHKVPKGSRFDINTPTKHLYPMHDPVRYEEERDVGHGIVSRQVIHKARGGQVEPTISQMLQELAKGGKVNSIPKEPGSTPVKEGHVRLYHQTDGDNLREIEKHGLLLKHAKGIEGPRAIYAGEKPFYGDATKKPTLEFQVPKEHWDAPFVLRDVKLEDFIAAHYPWHHHARYLEANENKGAIDNVLAGKFDNLEGDTGKAVDYIKAKYKGNKSSGGTIYMAKGGSVKEPKSTVKAYKMFRADPKQPGKLFPLFVDAKTPVPMNKWVDAKEGEMKDGKVKSKIGPLAYRPGWHAGDLPIATHIGDKDDEQKAEIARIKVLRDAMLNDIGNDKEGKKIVNKMYPFPSWVNAPRLRNPRHIWAEVDMPNDVDWQSEATRRGYNDDGNFVANQAHITDQMPKGGHYRYKTNSNMTGNWLIGGSMKVKRILKDEEVQRINEAAGASDLPRIKPMKQEMFGFAHGGSVGDDETIAPEEFKAEEYVNYKAEGGAVEPTQEQMREALRQKMRNGMYSPLERLAVDIPRNKGTGAEFMNEISKRPGYKAEEVADRKIPIPEGKMSKLEFLKHLRQHSNPPLKEHMLQDLGDRFEARDERANDYYGDYYNNLSPEQRNHVKNWVNDNAAKYEKYQIPGGENYREMLLKLPSLDRSVNREIMSLMADKKRTDPAEWQASPDSQRLEKLMKQAKDAPEEYTSDHWRDHPNTLAHIRLSDREGPNGEKLLHMEELQSDWHQQGRKRSYNVKPTPEELTKISEFERKSTNNSISMAERAEWAGLINKREGEIPDAPFKKSWHELGMKHVLHHAAKNGYEGVVITPGNEQAKRWNDEGLKVHYDKKIPEFLNKFGKPFGVGMKPHAHRISGEPEDYGDASERLGLAHIPMNELTLDQNKRIADEADKKLHYFPINDQMRTSILKEGMPQYMRGGIVHKAEGGTVLPIEQIKAQMMNRNLGLNQLQSIGANEAPSMGIKAYVPPAGRPDNGQMPVGGVDTSQGDLPVGGIDMSRGQPGNQLMPNPAGQQPGMDQVPQGDKIGTMDGTGMPPNPNANPNQMGSNILQMTPQGQAMAAMKPQGLAKGGSAKSVEEMKAELAAKKDPSMEKRVTVAAPGAGGVKGIVVPKHLIEGNPKAGAEGLKNMMDARAKVYGEEHRDPLNLGQMAKIHKQALEEHFAKPLKEQKSAEREALNRIRAAKFIKHNRDTLDESEKLDTVEHEHDEEGRSHVGYASKGIAGRALFPKGHGKDMDYKVINTCPGQTEGCGGGMNAEGIVDTKKGSCFAPNAESQYAAAVSRRAGHAIAKHDPAMTKDWVIAHTGSMRGAANKADKQNKRMLFRPNVVDETDLSSRHIIRHLNEQRRIDDKPPIIANSYGKTNELHDPENGYHITHSNVGPKVKNGREVTQNIGRDKARVRNTVMAADNYGDFKNEQGNKTPPKGSYMVTDVKRGSPMAKSMEKAITHAKYWSTGRSEKDLTPEEREEGPEGHFGGNGKPTTPDKAHYGHTTHEGLRYDYQKQHILHPRLVQVGKNDDGTPHMIPTDSRFKDTEFLPKNRYKTKNGKEAGHILMTTPTESTSNIGHQTSFTHNVSPSHVEHAEKNNGEYVIDKPEDQAKAKGKEYAAPEVIKFQPKPKAYAMGGSVGGRHIGFSDDDFHAFPEQNVVAQRHLAMRGEDYEPVAKHSLSDHKHKVTMNRDMDTMLLELTRNKKAK